MVKTMILAGLLSGIYLNLFSQLTMKIRYKDPVFEKVRISKGIPYFVNPGVNGSSTTLSLDLYEPEGDDNLSRPIIIWMHGGGFKYGNRKTGGIPRWCKQFVQRGYICVSIDYTLSRKKPLRKFHDLVAGCIDVMSDLQRSVTFLKQHAATYRIDTNRIIAGGNSAGAITALQSVYSSPYEMMQLINDPGYETMSRAHNPAGLSAIINFWGALFDSSWLKNERIPIVSAHGTRDKIVRFDRKGPVNGSLAIHREADALGIPNALLTFPGYGHELQRHFNPLFAGRRTKKRWKEAGDFAAAFLYRELFRQ